MRFRSATIVLALIASAFALSGCSAGTPVRPAQSGSAGDSFATVASTTASPAVEATGSGAAPVSRASSPSAAELASMQKQLDAMQKEIDALALPSDNGFSSAEGAVY